ncbi:hypothetical protein I6J39_16960 [Streptomyces californicus]|uniref:Uncharacterized protein n=1 Tax=Streptomyces californicus TaxID=67351 RepID=A0ABX7J3A7_9ACTN|nr:MULTISPECIES: hypothetical protein [Streptomyces]QRV28813.1 hypothetical protein I6J39_16960 [Streptomyces californicus]QRV42227.1 hypothetical protein I6J41_16875 [Streptomyces californicus]
MTTYFNERTGDRVEMDGRSARLDSLPNWKRLGDDEPNPPVVADGILSRPSLAGPRAERGPGQVLVETTPPAAHEVPTQDTPPVELTPVSQAPVGEPRQPAKNASRADWQAYAHTRAKDSNEEAEIEGLTRDELAARYGGDS